MWRGTGSAGILMMVLLAGCSPQTARLSHESTEARAQMYAEMGLAYLNQGNPERALERLHTALTLAPNLPSANHYTAEVYQQLGRPEEAERYYRLALRHDDDNPMIHNNFGAFLCGRGQYAEAEKQLMLAAKNPANTAPELAYENAGLCMQRIPDLVKAEQYYRTALATNTRLSRTLYQMALLNYEQQHLLPARGFLQRYEAEEQPSPQALLLGYRIERALKNTAAADSYARQLRAKFPAADEVNALEQDHRSP